MGSESGLESYLDSPLRKVIGIPSAKLLEALGLETVGDLLAYYPRRYADPAVLTDISDLELGVLQQFQAQIESVAIRSMRSRHGAVLEAVVSDVRGRTMPVIFFGRSAGTLRYNESRLVVGEWRWFTGKPSLDPKGKIQVTHPKIDADPFSAEERNHPVAVYRATAKVDSEKIAKAIQTVLGPLRPEEVPDPIPVHLRERLVDSGEMRCFGEDRWSALQRIHRPDDPGDWYLAQDRLRFEEAFILQVVLAQRRAKMSSLEALRRPHHEGGILDALDARLPYTLTDGQLRVGAVIASDLGAPHPMHRLLQGEVGSGKTVVALRAMLQVVDAGGQAALLAPTEVLAAQHRRSLENLLGHLAEGGLLGGSEIGTRVALLTGSQNAAARRRSLAQIAGGEAGIVVGTHALIQDQVQFADLGLVVVDEQHRFGVRQRDALRAKANQTPHLLVMTATPIPRTVAMTAFGDLETSTLDEIPAGRQGITSHVVDSGDSRWMQRIWQRAREEIDAGRRVFVVCPRIDEDEAAPTEGPPLASVAAVQLELASNPDLAGVGIGVLHGRMAPDDKDAAMEAFSSGQSPLLVCTTVIEVGVDVPEATMMIILNSERYGLAQLHQLRGRVGRGSDPSLCLLVADRARLSLGRSWERLNELAATQDGFKIADLDLELRREGDVLGDAQSGKVSSFQFLRVIDDIGVIQRARVLAAELVAADPDLEGYPLLRSAIEALDPEREEFLERS